MSDALNIPQRAALTCYQRDDGVVVVVQDTGGAEPEDTPVLYLCTDDALRLAEWLAGNLGPGGGDG